jgi:hypothetical protein
MKATTTGKLTGGRAWEWDGNLFGWRWHLRLTHGEAASPERARDKREAEPQVIGTLSLSPHDGLALHYDFVQVFLEGLMQRRCRIRVYRVGGRSHPHPRVVLPTIVVCSPIEWNYHQRLAPIATVVWHALGRPEPLIWIAQEWMGVSDNPHVDEDELLPEFFCTQFHHDGSGTLSNPVFCEATRDHVQDLVGSLEMLWAPERLPETGGTWL